MQKSEMQVLSQTEVSLVSGGYDEPTCGTVYPGWHHIVLGPIYTSPIVIVATPRIG